MVVHCPVFNCKSHIFTVPIMSGIFLVMHYWVLNSSHVISSFANFCVKTVLKNKLFNMLLPLFIYPPDSSHVISSFANFCVKTVLKNKLFNMLLPLFIYPPPPRSGGWRWLFLVFRGHLVLPHKVMVYFCGMLCFCLPCVHWPVFSFWISPSSPLPAVITIGCLLLNGPLHLGYDVICLLLQVLVHFLCIVWCPYL